MRNNSPLITGHDLGTKPDAAPLEFVSDQASVAKAQAGIDALKARNAEESALDLALGEDKVPHGEFSIEDLL